MALLSRKVKIEKKTKHTYTGSVITSPTRKIEESEYLEELKKELTIGAVIDTHIILRRILRLIAEQHGVKDPATHLEAITNQGLGYDMPFIKDFLEEREYRGFFMAHYSRAITMRGVKPAKKGDNFLIYQFTVFGPYIRVHFPIIYRDLGIMLQDFPHLYPYKLAIMDYLCFGIERGRIWRPFPVEVISSNEEIPRTGIAEENNKIGKRAVATLGKGISPKSAPLLLAHLKGKDSWPSFVRQLIFYKLRNYDHITAKKAYEEMNDLGFHMSSFGFEGKKSSHQMKIFKETLVGKSER